MTFPLLWLPVNQPDLILLHILMGGIVSGLGFLCLVFSVFRKEQPNLRGSNIKGSLVLLVIGFVFGVYSILVFLVLFLVGLTWEAGKPEPRAPTIK